jgi:hypothetical protein
MKRGFAFAPGEVVGFRRRRPLWRRALGFIWLCLKYMATVAMFGALAVVALLVAGVIVGVFPHG